MKHIRFILAFLCFPPCFSFASDNHATEKTVFEKGSAALSKKTREALDKVLAEFPPETYRDYSAKIKIEGKPAKAIRI